MEQPIVNPSTPYVGPINGGFTAGKLVRIQGYVSPVGERININLQSSEKTDPTDDIALHVSIRLLEGYVARNSLQSGIWGEEQGDGELPIQPGERFEVIVLSAPSQYKIAINGRHYCEFTQRLSSSSVNHLSIDGDVSLSLISYESGTPTGGPDTSASPPPQTHASYAPPPSAPAFGPPAGGFDPRGSYGPPPGQYQPPGYSVPPPPGLAENGKESEFGSFLESAGTVLAGAISSGAAASLLGSLSGGGANQQPHPQPPPQQNYGAPQGGGQDTLGGLGSLLSTLTGQNTQSQAPPPQQQSGYGAPQGGGQDALSGLGSLLSAFTGQNNQSQVQAPQQQQSYSSPQSGNQDALAGLGSLLSSFSGQNAQSPPQQQPAPQAAAQGGGQDVLGGITTLLSTLSTHNVPAQAHPQSAFDPANVGGQGSVGGLGSVGSLLSTLAGQVITAPKQDEKH